MSGQRGLENVALRGTTFALAQIGRVMRRDRVVSAARGIESGRSLGSWWAGNGVGVLEPADEGGAHRVTAGLPAPGGLVAALRPNPPARHAPCGARVAPSAPGSVKPVSLDEIPAAG